MAVYMPNEMNFEGKNFSMIISGSPGTGKTTLALSAPDPVLVDFDEGVSRVKASHRKPTIMGDTYEEIRHDIETSPLVKQCKTIVIDTGGAFITYLQDWAIRDNPTANKQKNSNAISQKGFGAVKAEFVRFTNYLRSTMKKNVIYIFHTVEEKDGDVIKYRLMCEGSAKNIVWQPCTFAAAAAACPIPTRVPSVPMRSGTRVSSASWPSGTACSPWKRATSTRATT